MTEQSMRLTHPHHAGIAPMGDDGLDVELAALYPHEPGVVRLNLISADGAAAGPDGSSRSINGPDDLRVLRVVRRAADVVLVGARTARAEWYTDIPMRPAAQELRIAAGLSPRPHLAIVTHTGELPEGLDPATTWILTSAHSPAARTASGPWAERVVVAGEQEWDPELTVEALAARGLTRIVCEGGPQIAGRLLEADLVDEYCLTRSPLMGGDYAPRVPEPSRRLHLAHRIEADGFAMERWARPER
jgi:riboflavin biosynthesis pyrimidine reductase